MLRGGDPEQLLVKVARHSQCGIELVGSAVVGHDPQHEREQSAFGLFAAATAIGLVGLALADQIGRLSVARSISQNQ